MAALHRLQNLTKNDNLKKYYGAVYQSDKCIWCPNITEDHTHMSNCPNNPHTDSTREKTRKRVASRVAKATGLNPNSSLLLPLQSLVYDKELAPADPKKRPGLLGVSKFPFAAAQVGLIPSSLKAALKELGVPGPKVPAVAKDIVVAVHDRLYDSYRARCKEQWNQPGMTRQARRAAFKASFE